LQIQPSPIRKLLRQIKGLRFFSAWTLYDDEGLFLVIE
jgi:hypothetical protein